MLRATEIYDKAEVKAVFTSKNRQVPCASNINTIAILDKTNLRMRERERERERERDRER